eukprot:scaffold312_cov409-Pavlova_lutheri.AAC.1
MVGWKDREHLPVSRARHDHAGSAHDKGVALQSNAVLFLLPTISYGTKAGGLASGCRRSSLQSSRAGPLWKANSLGTPACKATLASHAPQRHESDVASVATRV